MSKKTLFPVIFSVPHELDKNMLKGREKVKFLSDLARSALAESSKISQLSLKKLKKDSRGAPIPFEGVYWSISHKSDYVAALCADFPVGIDIEKIIPRSEGLFERVADEKEWKIGCHKNWDFFFRLFTAKEAVLKVGGEGLKDLKKCRLKTVINDHQLVLDYLDQFWTISHFWVNGHIVSITSSDCSVKWNVGKNKRVASR